MWHLNENLAGCIVLASSHFISQIIIDTDFLCFGWKRCYEVSCLKLTTLPHSSTMEHYGNLDSILVGLGCVKKYHRLERLHRRNSSFTVLEAESLRSRCQQDWLLLLPLPLSSRQPSLPTCMPRDFLDISLVYILGL